MVENIKDSQEHSNHVSNLGESIIDKISYKENFDISDDIILLHDASARFLHKYRTRIGFSKKWEEVMVRTAIKNYGESIGADYLWNMGEEANLGVS